MPGAGILPIAVYKNKLYFLFGKENKYNDTPGWCDFGGGMERGETVIETSLRRVGSSPNKRFFLLLNKTEV